MIQQLSVRCHSLPSFVNTALAATLIRLNQHLSPPAGGEAHPRFWINGVPCPRGQEDPPCSVHQEFVRVCQQADRKCRARLYPSVSHLRGKAFLSLPKHPCSFLFRPSVLLNCLPPSLQRQRSEHARQWALSLSLSVSLCLSLALTHSLSLSLSLSRTGVLAACWPLEPSLSL